MSAPAKRYALLDFEDSWRVLLAHQASDFFPRERDARAFPQLRQPDAVTGLMIRGVEFQGFAQAQIKLTETLKCRDQVFARERAGNFLKRRNENPGSDVTFQGAEAGCGRCVNGFQ